MTRNQKNALLQKQYLINQPIKPKPQKREKIPYYKSVKIVKKEYDINSQKTQESKSFIKSVKAKKKTFIRLQNQIKLEVMKNQKKQDEMLLRFTFIRFYHSITFH